MIKLQANLGVSFLLNTHEMAVVERQSDDCAVLHLERIIEIGPRQKVFGILQQPFTKALIKAIAIAYPKIKQLDRDP